MPQILSASLNQEVKKIDHQVGRKIRNIRIINGLTQKEFAEKLGFSFQQIQKYENGRNRISVGTIAFIANAMNISFEQFMLDNDLPAPKYDDSAPLHKNGVGDGRNSKIQIEIIKWINQIHDKEICKLILDLLKSIVKQDRPYNKQDES